MDAKKQESSLPLLNDSKEFSEKEVEVKQTKKSWLPDKEIFDNYPKVFLTLYALLYFRQGFSVFTDMTTFRLYNAYLNLQPAEA